MTEVIEKDLDGVAGTETPVAFNEAASAGYTWQHEEVPGLEISSYIDRKNPRSDSIGGSVTRVFNLKAETPGNYQVCFTYRRPWKNEPEKKITINYKVHAPYAVQRR